MRLIDRLMNRMTLAKMAKGGEAALAKLDELAAAPRTRNAEFLMQLIKDNADTEFGRAHGFAGIGSVEEFKERVPYSDYDAYAPAIERMVEQGEEGLITAYPVVHYAVSSGSVGVPKRIPVTKPAIEHYNALSSSRFYAHAAQAYARRHGGKALRGYGLNTMEASVQTTEGGSRSGPYQERRSPSTARSSSTSSPRPTSSSSPPSTWT